MKGGNTMDYDSYSEEEWDEYGDHCEEREYEYGGYTGDYAEWARDYDRDRM